MNQFEVSFSESEINDIYQEAMRLTAVDAEEVLNNDYQRLLIKAHMLNIAYEKQKRVLDIENMLTLPELPKRLKGKSDSELSNEELQVMNNYRLQKARYERQMRYFHYLYPFAFDFDEELTRFRNKVPRKAAYVIETKEGLKTYTMSLLELWQLYDTERSRIFVDEKQMIRKQALQQTYTILEEQLKNKKDNDISDQDQLFHIKQAEAAYKGVINRLDCFRRTRNSIRKKNNPNLKASKSLKGSLLMWKDNSQWQIGSIQSEGDIKEAYVALLMADHVDKCLCQINAGAPDYYNHYFIEQFYIKFIMNVTSLAAIVEEDVIAKDIQYAVKSLAAGLPSIKQYIETAQYIINSPELLSARTIEDHLQNKYNNEADEAKRLRNKMIEDLSKVANDSKDAVIEIITTNKF